MNNASSLVSFLKNSKSLRTSLVCQGFIRTPSFLIENCFHYFSIDFMYFYALVSLFNNSVIIFAHIKILLISR